MWFIGEGGEGGGLFVSVFNWFSGVGVIKGCENIGLFACLVRFYEIWGDVLGSGKNLIRILERCMRRFGPASAKLSFYFQVGVKLGMVVTFGRNFGSLWPSGFFFQSRWGLVQP